MILTQEQILYLARQIPWARLDVIRYASDSVVRKYLNLPFSKLQYDLGVEVPEITIVSGLGVLTCNNEGCTLSKEYNKPVSIPLPVSEELAMSRYSICKSCEKFNRNTDKCGTCGCGTEMSIQSKSIVFKCPENKWPL